MFRTRAWLTRLLIGSTVKVTRERHSRSFASSFSPFLSNFFYFISRLQRTEATNREDEEHLRVDGTAKSVKKLGKLRGQGWGWPMQKYSSAKPRVAAAAAAAAARIFRERAFSSSRVARDGKRTAIKFTAWPRWLPCIYSWSFPRGSSRNFRVERLCTSTVPLLLFPRLRAGRKPSLACNHRGNRGSPDRCFHRKEFGASYS